MIRDQQWWKLFTKTRKRFPYLSACRVFGTTLRKPYCKDLKDLPIIWSGTNNGGSISLRHARGTPTSARVVFLAPAYELASCVPDIAAWRSRSLPRLWSWLHAFCERTCVWGCMSACHVLWENMCMRMHERMSRFVREHVSEVVWARVTFCERTCVWGCMNACHVLWENMCLRLHESMSSVHMSSGY